MERARRSQERSKSSRRWELDSAAPPTSTRPRPPARRPAHQHAAPPTACIHLHEDPWRPHRRFPRRRGPPQRPPSLRTACVPQVLASGFFFLLTASSWVSLGGFLSGCWVSWPHQQCQRDNNLPQGPVPLTNAPHPERLLGAGTYLLGPCPWLTSGEHVQSQWFASRERREPPFLPPPPF